MLSVGVTSACRPRPPAMTMPPVAAGLVALLLLGTGCNDTTPVARERGGPGASSGAISWTEARALLRHCDVTAVEQTHSRLVTLTLRSGARRYAREPRIDDLFREINRLPARCRPATIATE